MKRVILKKTTYFNKKHKGLSKRITRYLENYVDEVGKAAQKRGEAPWLKSEQATEARLLLPVEKTGVFYTGGFLGEETSPGSAEANKQKGWIRRFTSRYVRSLEKSPKRRTDGYRFVMSMGPEAVKNLTSSNISCDQAMREIWRTTIDLYRERHGWSNPKDDLAWIAGAHHDTDNAHLHVLLFPTTKSGKLLRTNNARGKERVDDLNEMIAMANIATEIFWRELLPLNMQSNEFKEQLINNPDLEPALPTIESFKARSGIPGQRRDEEEIPNKPITTLDSKFAEDQNLEYGEIPILSKIKKKIGLIRGRIQLRATVAVALKWTNTKLKFFGIIKSLNNEEQCEKISQDLKKNFPIESQDLNYLKAAQGIIENKKVQEEIAELFSSKSNYTSLLLARISGDSQPEDIDNSTVLDWSSKLANVFENATTKKDSQTKLLAIYKEGLSALDQKQNEEQKTLKYRRIRRGLEKLLKLNETLRGNLEPALKCIKKVIRGSKRISLVLEARNNEAKNSVSISTDGKASMRTEKREWQLTKTEEGLSFEVKENEGKPWPSHLDPDTVIEPLKDMINRGDIEKSMEFEIPRAKINNTSSLTDIERPLYKTEKELEDESPLELLLRLRGRKNMYRKKEALENMKRYRLKDRAYQNSGDSDEQSTQEIEGPEMDMR